MAAAYQSFIQAAEDVDGVRFGWNVIPTNRVEATRMVRDREGGG